MVWSQDMQDKMMLISSSRQRNEFLQQNHILFIGNFFFRNRFCQQM